MLFPTKSKVNDALLQLLTRSIRIEGRVKSLNEEMQGSGSGLFGPALEIEEFREEVAEGTKAISLMTAAVQFEQVAPRVAAKKLAELDARLIGYEQAIAAAETSYGLSRSA